MPTTAASTVTFIPIVPEYVGPDTLPVCPDGSGDLWWDDASYIRYQSDPGPAYEPEHIAYDAVSPGYCEGKALVYQLDVDRARSCPCHTPASLGDPPF